MGVPSNSIETGSLAVPFGQFIRCSHSFFRSSLRWASDMSGVLARFRKPFCKDCIPFGKFSPANFTSFNPLFARKLSQKMVSKSHSNHLSIFLTISSHFSQISRCVSPRFAFSQWISTFSEAAVHSSGTPRSWQKPGRNHRGMDAGDRRRRCCHPVEILGEIWGWLMVVNKWLVNNG